jgi:hypothetical protein
MEADLVDQDNIVNYVIPASVETFLDGEVRSLHSQPEEPRLEELFGTYEFKHGTFMPSLKALREQTHNERSFEGDAHTDDPLIGFERFCARLVAMSTAEGGPDNLDTWQVVDKLAAESGQAVDYSAVHTSSNPLDMSGIQPTTRIKGSKIVVGQFEEQLDRAPQTVLHYGPSVQGRYHIDTQVRMLQRGVRPFSYMPIARGAFVNSFLMKYLDARMEQAFGEPGLVKQLIAKQLYLGREDGISSATDEIIRAQKANGAPYDIFDLVISSGLYGLPHDELAKGMENAYKVLRTGGALALRHPVPKVTPTAIGGHEALSMAKEAGFKVDEANVQYEMTGPSGNTDSLAVVLRKTR